MRLNFSFLAIKENAMSGTNPTPLITGEHHPHSEAWWWHHHALCFSLAGTWKLVRIERIMDGAKYSDILEGNLFQSSRDLRLGRRFTFQQDHDPKHTAKAKCKWLKGNI